jgi:hypothetical protein
MSAFFEFHKQKTGDNSTIIVLGYLIVFFVAQLGRSCMFHESFQTERATEVWRVSTTLNDGPRTHLLAGCCEKLYSLIQTSAPKIDMTNKLTSPASFEQRTKTRSTLTHTRHSESFC